MTYDHAASTKPLDVWLRFNNPNDHEDEHIEEDAGASCPICEEADAEANVFPAIDGRVFVAWYLTGVGLVTKVYFDTYAQATAWLEAEGFQDFSS